MWARSILAIAVALVGLNGGVSHAVATESASLPKEITGKDGAPLVLIPAGSYPMGVPFGDRDGGRDEYPRHIIEVNEFYMDKYEVTNGRYLEFV
ncbi:MAG: SUMF1/EgtB/PvdO family nonheme iron enzyme, partial [Nitrospirota bacterium]|nr:SUMF1/EgtB/PvdO family nonheme iron enzyme [Nitrospirota bacterium]